LRRHPEVRYELAFLWEYRLAFLFTRNGITIQSKEWMQQIVGNMALFVPMGVLYGEMSAKRGKQSSWKKAVLTGLCLSGLIELSQLILHLGLCEFDDVLNNTVGAALGYVIWYIGTTVCEKIAAHKQ